MRRVGRKPEAEPCTEEHEPRRRRGDLGEPAQEGKARHHRQGRHVDAAGVGELIVLIRGDLPGCRLCCRCAAPTVRTARYGLTGQKSAEVTLETLEGRTRTLSGPSPDMCPARTVAPSAVIRTRHVQFPGHDHGHERDRGSHPPSPPARPGHRGSHAPGHQPHRRRDGGGHAPGQLSCQYQTKCWPGLSGRIEPWELVGIK